MSHKKGIYLADGSFMKFDQKTSGSLTNEIATRSRSIDYYSIGNMYLPNPDPVLKKQGRDIRVYEDLLTDDRVGGSMINRINATLALDWEIDRGKSSKSRQAKAVIDIFKGLPLNTIIEHLIRNTRGFGYGPAESLWRKRGDGLNVPYDVVFKPQYWFVFGPANDLKFLSKENQLSGEELPHRRFLCPTNEASYANPYGLALNSRCFWPVVFKRGGWRFLVQFMERWAQVFPIGKLPRSADPKDVDAFLDVLEQMVQDGLAVIPDDGSVELLESGTKGSSADLFKLVFAEANSAISTVWLGHAGAGQSTPGNLGGQEISVEIRKDLRDSDKTMVEETLNKLIDWICIENWGSAADAPRFCLWEEDDVDTAQAERDINLTAAMEKSDLKLTQVYFERTYNLAPGEVEVKTEPAPTPPATKFNTPPFTKGWPGGISDCPQCCTFTAAELADLPETKLATRLATAADQELSAFVGQLRTLAMSSSSLTELHDSIAAAFPGMNSETLGGIMAEETTRAFMAGRIDAESGD